MEFLSKFTLPGIGFILTLAFGFWVSHVGRPYNGVLFNVHKLIALGTVVLAAMQIYQWLKTAETQTLLIVLIVLAGVSVVALFASGALLSIGNVNYQVVKLIHNIAPILLVLAMGITLYLMSGKRI
ncbi:MAG: hypothetical protein HND47_07540 [Chloroflexi bacterium]|nr:hypothetical protein [Chloroflexota bacterium]